MNIYTVTYFFYERTAGREHKLLQLKSSIYYRSEDIVAVEEAARKRFERSFPDDILISCVVTEIEIETIKRNHL